MNDFLWRPPVLDHRQKIRDTLGHVGISTKTLHPSRYLALET